MQQDKCPHCHTRSGLNNYNVLILSLENWPTIILYAFAVLAFSEKFQYSGAGCIAFMVLAILPVIVSFEKKHNCENCGIDFQDLQPPVSTRLNPEFTKKIGKLKN